MATKIKYVRIVFCQGDDAIEPLQIIEEHGELAAIDYLREWESGDSFEISDIPASGKSDDIFESGNYRLSYNTRFGYIGLELLESIKL